MSKLIVVTVENGQDIVSSHVPEPWLGDTSVNKPCENAAEEEEIEPVELVTKRKLSQRERGPWKNYSPHYDQ